MKAKRYQVADFYGVIFQSDDRAAATKYAKRLNMINFKQGGLWGGGRYCVVDTHNG